MLTSEMLIGGIWFPAGTTVCSDDTSYREDLFLRRSENTPEYTAALKGLMAVFDGHTSDYVVAVVSMCWCSRTNRLVTAKRVWLSIHRNSRVIRTFSHVDDDFAKPTRNFTEFWGDPELDQNVWERRFCESVSEALEQ
jgi:hypothetical protein